MNTTITETDFGIEIEMVPHNKEELALLFRFVNNAKAEKPMLTVSFNKTQPYGHIFMKKVKPSVQRNSISK
jgi:hypothetical protein